MSKKKQELDRINEYNPYLGLDPFKESNASFFCGRDRQIKQLYSLVDRHILTILYGRSGYGKTSLLRAGLFPKLREKYLPIYLRIKFDNLDEPILIQIKHEVEEKIKPHKVGKKKPILSELTFWEYFHSLNLKNNRTPILVFDQFEEIFTLGKSHDENLKEFLKELGCAVQNWIPRSVVEKYSDEEIPFEYDKPRLKVILSLREDYLKDLEELDTYIPKIRNEKIRLHQMNGAEALDAIYKPGKKIITKDNANRLLQKILKTLNSQETDFDNLEKYEAEPFMLSLICHKISSSRERADQPIDDILIDKADIDNVIVNFYNEHTSETERQYIFSLVSEDNVRIPRYKEEFINRPFLSEKEIDQLRVSVKRLVDERILRETEWNGKIYVELIHDVLIPVVKADKERLQDKKKQCYENYEKGNDLLGKNNFNEAYKHYILAHQLASELQEKLIAGQTMEKLGVIEQKRNQFKKAEDFYHQALAQFDKIQEHGAQGRIHERLAMYYEKNYHPHGSNGIDIETLLHQYKLAKEHYRRTGDDMGSDRVNESIQNLIRSGQPWAYLVNLNTNKVQGLIGNIVQIGRNTSQVTNDIDIPNSYVSRRHLTISDKFIIEDTNSRNGTTINGEVLLYGHPKKLSDGDIIGLAGSEAFQFFINEPKIDSSSISTNAWAVFVQSNEHQYLDKESYSLIMEGNKLLLFDELLPDEVAIMKLRYKRNVELFKLNKTYESDLLTNDYSPEFIWEFSKNLLIHVFTPQFLEGFLEWVAGYYGTNYRDVFLIQLEADQWDQSFVEQFAVWNRNKLFAWEFFAQPSQDKSEFILWYNRDLGETWNPNVAGNLVSCRILAKSNELIVMEDKSEMYFPENEWQVLYIRNNQFFPFPSYEWILSFHPAMCCAYLEKSGNNGNIKELGPFFQIIQLNNF